MLMVKMIITGGDWKSYDQGFSSRNSYLIYVVRIDSQGANPVWVHNIRDYPDQFLRLDWLYQMAIKTCLARQLFVFR